MAKKNNKPAQVRKTVAVEQAKVDKVKAKYNLKSDSEVLRFCLDRVVEQLSHAGAAKPAMEEEE